MLCWNKFHFLWPWRSQLLSVVVAHCSFGTTASENNLRFNAFSWQPTRDAPRPAPSRRSVEGTCRWSSPPPFDYNEWRWIISTPFTFILKSRVGCSEVVNKKEDSLWTYYRGQVKRRRRGDGTKKFLWSCFNDKFSCHPRSPVKHKVIVNFIDDMFLWRDLIKYGFEPLLVAVSLVQETPPLPPRQLRQAQLNL